MVVESVIRDSQILDYRHDLRDGLKPSVAIRQPVNKEWRKYDLRSDSLWNVEFCKVFQQEEISFFTMGHKDHVELVYAWDYKTMGALFCEKHGWWEIDYCFDEGYTFSISFRTCLDRQKWEMLSGSGGYVSSRK